MIRWLLNLIFPLRCIFCSKILNYNADINICEDCVKEIPYIEDTTKLKNEVDYYDDIICILKYEGYVKKAIRNFKFKNKPFYWKTFVKLMEEKVEKMTRDENFDFIMSIPLHPRRQAQRGYNQSYLLSLGLSKAINIPDKSFLINRVRETKTQSLLRKQERILNIRNAFQINDTDQIKGKKVFVVDDILTTGSTLNECCKILKRAGAEKVVGIVIATGRRF